jgi:hypothetical protein
MLGRRVERIDVHFAATYQNGSLVRPQENWTQQKWTGVME